jgi:hypothetical protein
MINMVQNQQKYVKKAYGGGSVSSEKTANLIANAIMHQKQKAMGIEESAPEEENDDYKPLSMNLKAKTQKIHESLGVKVSEPAPVPALPELSNAIAVKPIVSKDELMESQNIKPLSQNDQAAKDAAVQKTLNLMRSMSGLQPKEETSNFLSSPSAFSSSVQSATDKAVQSSLEKKDIPMILPGPSPQAAPVAVQPIKKAQLEAPPKELTEQEKREEE